MSQNIPQRHMPKKPYHKLRSGFTQAELEDWRDYLVTHGYGRGGSSETSFTRRALLSAIGKTPTDIDKSLIAEKDD